MLRFPSFPDFWNFRDFYKLSLHELYQNLYPLIEFQQMSGPALPPNPTGDPPTTSTNHCTPTGSLAKWKGCGNLFGPPKPPPNPNAPSFVSVQKWLRSDTISPLRKVKEEIIRMFPRSNYWTLRMAQAITEKDVDPTEFCTSDSPDLLVLSFLTEMQKE